MNRVIKHVPVLKKEVVRALCLGRSEYVVDATFGQGGHAELILAQLSKTAHFIVIDRDPVAIRVAQLKLGGDKRVEIIHAPFSQLERILGERDLLGRISALLFDFGVSSPQLEDASRGFSFLHDGPLDMRMNPTEGIPASRWLREVSETDLASVLRHFGEERFAKRVARKIKKTLGEKRIDTTGELAALVEQTIPKREPKKHPATRTFQAIRIAVNDELAEISSVLPQATKALAPGGRVVMISFHSLEDRLVKRFFKEQSRGDPYPPDLPVINEMLSPKLKLVGKPLRAKADELHHNRRARSAVMRVAEKVA